MAAITQLFVDSRPEGGAVRLTFALPEGWPEVHILRMAPGRVPLSPTDPAGHLVYSGIPRAAGPDWRVWHSSANDSARRGLVWDLQAYEYVRNDERNLVDGTWDYYLYAKNGAAFSDPVLYTVEVQRRLQAYMSLDIKNLLYNRMRYHATDKKVQVLQQEHVMEGGRLPQVLLRVRHAVQSRDASEGESEQGVLRAVTFRATGEALILADDPQQRNDLILHFRTRLMGDFALLETLGWQGLELEDNDLLRDLSDRQVYAATLSLSGWVDGYIAVGMPYGVDTLYAAYRVYLD